MDEAHQTNAIFDTHADDPEFGCRFLADEVRAAEFDVCDRTVRHRIGDRRVLSLVKAFLKAGVLSEDGSPRETITGTPQGGILSPLLANIALSVLDEHFTPKWEALGPSWTRAKRRRAGEPTMRLIRYADDFVVMVHGTRDDTEALWDEVGQVLAQMGLRLSEEKTRVCHIDEGFDFLGWHINAGTGEAEPARKRSTPTRPRRACAPSWTRSDR